MKVTLTIVLLLSVNASCLSQNYIYRGGSKIDATPTWIFKLDNPSYTTELKVTIGKTRKGSAVIMLSAETLLDEIGGTVILYLADGSALLLHTRIAHDRVNDASVVLYSVLFSNLYKLKTSDISTIRYSLIYPDAPNMRIESYTAQNKGELDPLSTEKADHFSTAIEIAALFTSSKN